MEQALQRPEKKDLRKYAYEYLLNAMSSFKILPGDAVVEQEISDTLGISRTPVREALKQLEADGFVYHIRQKGTFATGISNDDIEEIFALRSILELAAAEYAVARMDDETLASLHRQIKSLDNKANEEDFFEVDGNLHKHIVDSMCNSRVSKIFSQLAQQVSFLRILSAKAPHRLLQSRQEHLGIIEALMARNLKLVRKRLTQHMENVKNNSLRINQQVKSQAKSRSSSLQSF